MYTLQITRAKQTHHRTRTEPSYRAAFLFRVTWQLASERARAGFDKGRTRLCWAARDECIVCFFACGQARYHKTRRCTVLLLSIRFSSQILSVSMCVFVIVCGCESRSRCWTADSKLLACGSSVPCQSRASYSHTIRR